MFPVSQRASEVFFLWLEKTMHNSMVVSLLVLHHLDSLVKNYIRSDSFLSYLL